MAPYTIGSTWKKNAEIILQGHSQKDVIISTFFAVLNQIKGNNWQGACHATCAVLHVLLTEQGVKNQVILGEAKIGPAFFNHSWIEIDDEVYDLAISNPLIPSYGNPPVFKGINVDNLNPTNVEYGVNSGMEDDEPTAFIKLMSIGTYLNKSPIHPTMGLWVAVLDGATQIGLKLDLIKMKGKYSPIKWNVK